MKNIQQKLLVVLALALCLLCICQWYGQTQQRNDIQTLNHLVDEKALAIQGYTNSIAVMDRQIAQMDARTTEFKEISKANDEMAGLQKREINKLQTQLQVTAESLTNQVAQYKQAVETLQAKLKEAYDGVQKQNDSIKQLIAERDDYVKKYNDSVKDRNEVVGKYNELVVRVESMQTNNAKATDR